MFEDRKSIQSSDYQRLKELRFIWIWFCVNAESWMMFMQDVASVTKSNVVKISGYRQ